MITFRHKGNFANTNRYFNKLKNLTYKNKLEAYGKAGVAALASATPIESGETAAAWFYEIEEANNRTVIRFCNSHINKGVPIAIILQYGHGTGTGGWVEGRDYINPAIQPIFDQLANDAWGEVTRL